MTRFLDTASGRPYEWDGVAVWLNGQLVGYADTERDAVRIANEHAADTDRQLAAQDSQRKE